MAVSAHPHRWTLPEYLRAWESGVFDETRTELLDGEVYDVSMGRWHGATMMRLVRALPNDRFEITGASLAAGQSLPDPDCWVLRKDAEPVEQLSVRMPRWAAADVLLVVEVSDETKEYDLGRKAVIYAGSGFGHYWVVAQEGLYVHTDPGPGGYGSRVLHRPGTAVTVPYAPEVHLTVTDLIAA